MLKVVQTMRIFVLTLDTFFQLEACNEVKVIQYLQSCPCYQKDNIQRVLD